MTDRPPPPDQDAALRRVLSRARHDEPVPPDVAARLDETLALLASGEQVSSTDRVSPLGRAVRRRRAAALLVAAAAVVAVGVGLTQVLGPAAQPEATSASDAAAEGLARETPPDRADAGPAEATQEGAARSGDGGDRSQAEAELGVSGGTTAGSSRSRRDTADGLRTDRAVRLALVGDPPRVRETRFARDALAVRSRARRAGPAPDARRPGPAPQDAADFACPAADWGPGRAVAVRYATAPAVLVLRPATRATQVADLVECGSADVLRSVTLPR